MCGKTILDDIKNLQAKEQEIIEALAECINKNKLLRKFFSEMIGCQNCGAPCWARYVIFKAMEKEE